MQDYNVQIDKNQLHLLVAQYLAENNLYQTLYSLQAESGSDLPIYNKQIDMLNQFFIEESYRDVLQFLVSLPETPELLELLFQITQLEFFQLEDYDEKQKLSKELEQYYSTISLKEVNLFNQRLEQFDSVELKTFKNQVFRNIQQCLVPYYNQFIGSECIFSQLEGRRLSQICQKYYKLQFNQFPSKERPKEKTIKIDLFEDAFNIYDKLDKSKDLLIGNNDNNDEKIKTEAQLQQCKTSDFHQQYDELRDFTAQAAENINTQVQVPYNQFATPIEVEKIPLIVNDSTEVSEPRYSLRESFNRISTTKSEKQSVSQDPTLEFKSSPMIRNQIQNSQYHVIKLYQENSEFQALIVQQIQNDGLFLLKFNPQKVETVKKYNLPFNMDFSTITEDKQFIIIANYEFKQIALFDLNFYDPIIVKCYEGDFDTKMQDVILYKKNIFVTTKTTIYALSLTTLEIVNYIRLDLKNDEFIEYFLLGHTLSLTTTFKIIHLDFSHNQLELQSQFDWIYSDGVTVSQFGLITNMKKKLYLVDLKTKQKQVLNDLPVKLVQNDVYTIYGVNSVNKLWKFTYRNADFRVSTKQIGSQEIQFFKICNGLVFWISENGLYGVDLLMQYFV